ncbi:532_t:CDS:2, partial [Racocetra persica]
ITKVRLLNPEMAKFIKNVPAVPKIVENQCVEFFKRANTVLKLIEKASINDVFEELKSRHLDRNEMYFNLLRPIFSQLHLSFRSWTELSLVEWTRYITTKHELKNDPILAERFIGVLSKNFKKIEMRDRSTICQLMRQVECIPTRCGVKKPSESYFPEVTLFSNLPNVTIEVNEEFFTMMEIRKHVDLKLVFDRLVNSNNLNHMKLVEYFTKHECDLKSAEIETLKKTAIWLKENNKSEINELN